MAFGWATTISDDELELVLQSVLILVVVCISVYYLFLRPAAATPNANNNNNNIGNDAASTTQQQQHQQPQQPQNGSIADSEARRRQQATPAIRHRNTAESREGPSSTIAALNVRSPPHTNSSYHAQVGHEGVVPFRYTKASVYESRSYGDGNGNGGEKVAVASTARQMANRKERARIFTKLFSSTRTENTGITQPPSRGSNVVISVPSDEARCPKLRKVLFLLGSYYNLFLVVAINDDANETENDNDNETGTTNDETNTTGRGKGITETEQFLNFQSTMKRIENDLRGINEDEDENENDNKTNDPTNSPILPEDILPSHRIVGATSIEGRVAFVRQLPKRPEFVLEYDGEVNSQLTRFGFGVLLYSNLAGRNAGDGVSSGIGKELIP